MNEASGSVGFRERTRAAKHEATHAGALFVLGVVPTVIEILPPHEGLGPVEGSCTMPQDVAPGVAAVAWAAGVLDGFGAQYDEAQLCIACPDDAAREDVLRVAAQVMEHRQFVAVRDALSRELLFRDRLDELEVVRIIQKVVPSATSA